MNDVQPSVLLRLSAFAIDWLLLALWGGLLFAFVMLANDGDPMKILYIAIAFAIVQLIDNILIQPLVMSKSVNLHPLIIVFAVLIGGQFFGLLGMLLAVPSAGIIKVTSMELYIAINKYHLI